MLISYMLSSESVFLTRSRPKTAVSVETPMLSFAIFCTFLQFFALSKMLTPVLSSKSELFLQNTLGACPLYEPRRSIANAPGLSPLFAFLIAPLQFY
jgi:hypothetical protein